MEERVAPPRRRTGEKSAGADGCAALGACSAGPMIPCDQGRCPRSVDWSKILPSRWRLALCIWPAAPISLWTASNLLCPITTTTNNHTGKVKAHELRNKTKSELGKQLEDLKKDLSSLRVQRTTGGTSAKVARIGDVRKAIARVLTVVNQKTKAALREKFSGEKGSKLPVDLREKKTRAIRRRLTPEQASKKTAKQTKKDNYYPKRTYAIRA